MVRTLSLLAAACYAAAQTAPATYTPPPTPVAWKFKPVRTIQARVQSSAPIWDSKMKAWIADFKGLPTDTNLKWAASLDTVNTASVEGALFYVQSEGISTEVAQAWGCARKTNMTYVWFYDIKVAQPYWAVAEFGDDPGKGLEYGTYAAMDNGMCTKQGTVIPPQCLQFTGQDYNANLGPYVGGEYRKDHPKAVYQNNVWFSFPGHCWTRPFDQKNDACRAAPQTKGGLCPRGTDPDGTTCTYSFEVLGFINIDDLVGITNMTNKDTNTKFKDRNEFCKAGLIEFDFEKNKTDVPFWADPLNATANEERSKKMMNMYAELIASKSGDAVNFKPFPTVASLIKENPPCYENSPRCAKAPFGCKRTLLAQVCEECKSESADCVKKPANSAPFPTLVKQFVPTRPPGSTPGTPGSPGAGKTPGSPGASGSASTVFLSAVSVVVMALFI